MRLLITGSRGWKDHRYLRDTLDQIHYEYTVDLLISGACPIGADRLCEQWATDRGIALDLHPADWKRHDEKCPPWHMSQPKCKRAGFRRNEEMVNLGPDMVVAFQLDGSQGTQHTIDLARKSGIEVIVIERWTDS